MGDGVHGFQMVQGPLLWGPTIASSTIIPIPIHTSTLVAPGNTIYVYLRMYVCICVYIYIYMCVSIYIYVYMYVYMYICVYMYIYIVADMRGSSLIQSVMRPVLRD